MRNEVRYLSFCYKRLLVSLLVCIAPLVSFAQQIQSEIQTTGTGDRILRQELVVSASLDAAWAAFTTPEGLRGWAVPLVEVDFRPGGSYRSHYDRFATLGDPGTITVHYVNFIPGRLITMQADLPAQLPPVILEARDRLFNIVEFESLGPSRTRVVSWGLGYGVAPEWDAFMNFFLQANEDTYRALIRYLEEGPRDWSAGTAAQ